MVYELNIRLFFSKMSIPDKARQDALWLLSKAVVVHPGEDNEDRGCIQLLKCHHDEDPAQPCEVMFDISP